MVDKCKWCGRDLISPFEKIRGTCNLCFRFGPLKKDKDKKSEKNEWWKKRGKK